MATVQTIEPRSTKTSRRAQVQARLDAYRKAELAILSGQSYEVEGLRLTRANLADVQKMINKLEEALATANRRTHGMSIQCAVPISL